MRSLGDPKNFSLFLQLLDRDVYGDVWELNRYGEMFSTPPPRRHGIQHSELPEATKVASVNYLRSIKHDQRF